ncbi:MAG: hypothetical protein ACXVYM_09520 [Gaiellaceae bacterium]
MSESEHDSQMQPEGETEAPAEAPEQEPAEAGQADEGDAPEGLVVSLLAPEIEGDFAVFCSLEDGLLLVEQYEGASDLTSFAERIERRLPAPYRARALRVDEKRFVVVARAIETIELPGVEGEEMVVVALPGEARVAVLDGSRTTLAPSELDAVLDESQPCLARLTNLDESVWELSVELL